MVGPIGEETLLLPPQSDPEMSLAVGGPLYALLIKLRLARRPIGGLAGRILWLTGVVWIPLLFLTVSEGNALSGSAMPFFYDIEAQARLLVALPILLIAEVALHRRLGNVVEQFQSRRMIAEDVQPAFRSAIASALRLRDSWLAELLILALVMIAAPLLWHYTPNLPRSAWYADPAPGAYELSRAGYWYIFIGLPLSQFFVLRLYFRLFIWARFLRDVSHLPLRIMPTHPDRVGGLAFLEQSVSGFGLLLLAQCVIASGFVATRVMTYDGSFLDYKVEIAALVLMLVVLVHLPMLFLTPQLTNVRLKGLEDCAVLGAAYARKFDAKWFDNGAGNDVDLLGSADIQSLADLAGSYEIVDGMRAVPFRPLTVIQASLFCAAPFLPLLFTVLSPQELVRRLAQLIL